ncbi:hypothetical protein JCM3766R1_006524 [Sporobolomyces carnicolor]
MSASQEIPAMPSYASLKPAPASTPEIDEITALLGTTIRVSVPSTSRRFVGTFVCIDPQGNLVLDQAIESELDAETAKPLAREGRDVGLVLIKRAIWGKVERLKTEAEMMRDKHDRDPIGCTPS